MSRKWITIPVGLILSIALAYVLFTLIVRPSNDRDWAPDQAILPTVAVDGDLVTIRNIRNFHYTSESDYSPAWYDKTFDLRELDSVWFVVEPFGEWQGAAHTFVSFGFADRDFLAISVEIRKETGESFSALKGLLRQYEIMYVIGDERDLIALRTNHRGDEVYLYPVRTTPERGREMFLEMVHRAHELNTEPEFYNTLTNTCTTNLVRHVNTIATDRISLRPAVLFPGYSDRLAWELGLIDTDLPFEKIRARFRINERAMRHAGDPEFSHLIRYGVRYEAERSTAMDLDHDRQKDKAVLRFAAHRTP